MTVQRERSPRACAAPALWLAALAVPLGANAEAGLHGLVRLSSDYLASSYSKSNGQPSLQGNLDYLAANGLYAGGWLSQVDFGGAALEAIAYAGGHRRLSADWTGDLALAAYGYDQRVYGRNGHYGELYASLHYRDLASFSASQAVDVYGLGHPVTNLGIKLGWPLSDVLRLSLGGGYQWATGAYHYDNLLWNAGLSWYASPRCTLELSYRGSRERNEQPHSDPPGGSLSDLAYDDRLLLSLSYGY